MVEFGKGECYETELRRHLFQFVVLQVPYLSRRSIEISAFYLFLYRAAIWNP